MKRILFIFSYLIFLNIALYIHYEYLKHHSLKTKYYYYFQNDKLIFPNINIKYLELNHQKYQKYQVENEFISNISIITQMSLNRLPRLYSLLERWNSIIHVVFYIRIYEYQYENFNPEDVLKEIYQPYLFQRIQLHLVVDKFVSKIYPLNELRNIAWKYVETKYIFSLDIDFIPSINFDSYLLKYQSFIKERIEQSLFIIPAFHYSCKSLSKIDTCMIDDEYYEIGQRATNYTKWRQSNEPYEIDYEIFYEPYFISSSNIIKYNQDFTIGHDKTSHLYELISLNYKLWVLPHLYIAHIPHSSHMPHSLLHNTYDPINTWVIWENFVRKIYKKSGFDLYCKTFNHTYIPYSFRFNTQYVCKNSFFLI